jgi:proteasome accessory factor C
VAPERFGVLQALLAYLLDACGEGREAEIPAQELVERFHIPFESLEEHLSLLNLVNFGGGCYAVYAELRGDEVHVDKELFGDTFRAPPRLTPLEARAIRLALEFVGPTIAADSHTTLDRVRKKLEDTFGEFDLAQTPEPHSGAEVDLVVTLTEAIRDRRLVEIEYLKEGDQAASTRLVEPYSIERQLPYWYVHTWDRTRDGERSFRLDRMRSAQASDETFDPRPEFDPRRLAGTHRAVVLYRPIVARWALEKGGRPLADGSAVRELQAGDDWLVGEILSHRGEAVLIEPADLRARIAEHAAELERALGAVRT